MASNIVQRAEGGRIHCEQICRQSYGGSHSDGDVDGTGRIYRLPLFQKQLKAQLLGAE